MMQEQRIFAALGKMSALLAHELRNPLTAAMGQAQLLEELLPEGRHKERVEVIGQELERLEELMQSLLEFINSRRVDRQIHDTTPLVRELEMLSSSPMLRIDTEHIPESWTFDHVTLLRAIDNVIHNALSFSPESEYVDVAMELRGGDFVIEVRDRGPGLPDDIDIFEPFVTSRIQGAGLGLSISQEIVRAHGGQIIARNHEDGGAVVTITLPYFDDLSEASFVEAI